jgi:hypothetical protein
MAQLDIRTMRAEDLDEKADVHMQAWFETYEGLVPDAWSRENITSKKMRAFQLRRGFERTFVACLDDKIVGFASFEPEARAFAGRPGVYMLVSDDATPLHDYHRAKRPAAGPGPARPLERPGHAHDERMTAS